MGGVFVLYLPGTPIWYPKNKDKSCLSCERIVNSQKVFFPDLPASLDAPLWDME